MKCQKCEKPATFHITDLTVEPLMALHLCPDCAKQYLQPEQAALPAPTMSSVIDKQLKLEQTAEELKELDSKSCPVCGVSFFEFRQAGRLGCPHDYEFFQSELEPLLLNVHGNTKHVGKHPRRTPLENETTNQVIQQRRELRDAVETEDYERASRIRDQIRTFETEVRDAAEGGKEPKSRKGGKG
ncbi:MAG: UvrB/UvrC motif-containing protein [Planctomycetota bacterium]|jgi:protein arginine kinase activator